MDLLLLATWGTAALAALVCSVRWPIARPRWAPRVVLHIAAVSMIVLGSGLAGAGSGPSWRTAPPWAGGAGRDQAAPPLGRPAGGPPPVARAAVVLGLYALVASASHAVMASRQARARERRALIAEARLANAQLAALQMQLNPHFLFNALNGIAALMHSDLDAADRMLGDLSELLRLALDATDTPEVPLRRELAFLDRYLAIEQTRYADRLTVVREVDPAALDALVPTLILQPLVENAIKHGVEPSRAPGTIAIRATRQGGTLRVAIADSGTRGPSRTPVSGHGIGLSNTRARLAQLYEDAHVLTVEPAEPHGTRVEVAIPYRTRARSEAEVAAS